MKKLASLLILVLFSCNGKPSKQEALDHYEEIYKISATTRPGETRLMKGYEAYITELASTHQGDSMELASLREDNAKVLDDLRAAKTSINALPAFDYKTDLKLPVIKVLDLQIQFHEKDMVAMLDAVSDGAISKEESAKATQADQNFAAISNAYKEWKAVRKTFCEEFGITYDDIKSFEDKYAPLGEE